MLAETSDGDGVAGYHQDLEAVVGGNEESQLNEEGVSEQSGIMCKRLISMVVTMS